MSVDAVLEFAKHLCGDEPERYTAHAPAGGITIGSNRFNAEEWAIGNYEDLEAWPGKPDEPERKSRKGEPIRYEAADPIEAFARHLLDDSGDTDPWNDDPEDDEEDEDEKHEFASTQVQLPEDIAVRVRAFAAVIPDADLAEGGRQDDIHITVKYGIESDEPDDVAAEIKDFGDVVVRLGTMSLFANDDADVLKVDVWSGRSRSSPDKSIYGLNKAVKRSVEHTETHPRYIPHVTVAYLKPGEGAKYEGLPIGGVTGKVVVFKSLMFSDRRREKTEIFFGDAD